MPDKSFLDTNVLVYAYDEHEPEKQKRAQILLQESIEQESGILSAQVLSEFFVTVTAKIRNPMSREQAEDIILKCALPVVDVDRSLVLTGIEMQREYGISYWDSLVIAAAERAGCRTILSEDLNEGQQYRGVKVVNPFR